MARRWQRPGVVALLGTTAIVVGSAFAGSPGAGGAPAPPPPPLHGSVAANGMPEGPAAGWHVTHPAGGRYVLELEGATDVDVTSWDVVGDVVVAPHGGGVFDVILERRGVAVDARFRFVAR